MTIYLSRQYSLSVDLIGYARQLRSLLASFLASVLVSWRIVRQETLYVTGNYRLRQRFYCIPLVNNVTLVVLFFALINCAILFLLPC